MLRGDTASPSPRGDEKQRKDKLGDDDRSMIMELMELRCDGWSTIFCTQYQKKNWHARLRGGIHADAIVDGIVLNAVWLESGEVNMRAHENETEQRRLLEAAPVATMTAVAGNHSQFHWKLKPITKVIMRANTHTGSSPWRSLACT